MKILRNLLIVSIISLVLSIQISTAQAQSQTPTPQATSTPSGIVTGKITNQNNPGSPVGELEVMLHILDQDQKELGMLHGQSSTDGKFTIADVPFSVGIGFVAAVVFDETTYYSPVVWSEAGKTEAAADVSVFESTPDLTNVRVEQMHVLFDFAQDGIEVNEIFTLSNLGDRTVRGGQDIPGNTEVKASVLFPLPENADFISFQPQDNTRFIKYPGGFADLSPIQPGESVNMLIASYLIPYTDPRTFTYQTILPVQRVNFALPHASGLKLSGDGLGAAEKVEGQDGSLFDVYPLENVPASTRLVIKLEGDLVLPAGAGAVPEESATNPAQYPLVIGLVVVGLGAAGGGVFWWFRSGKRSSDNEEIRENTVNDTQDMDAPDLNVILDRITQLDNQFEAGEIAEVQYQSDRAVLMAHAKSLLHEDQAAL